ncbi:hypothetical protein BASA81_003713 [Batrachochytrium salamandrivorans]|nr:hypothetical protein BASA81_003713 [Batrachochytrium salamandrivorans]
MKAIIEGFFVRTASLQAAVNAPRAATTKTTAKMSQEELAKLGRLAALDVSDKTPEFAQSVAQVLEFCSAVGNNPRNYGKPERFHQQPKPVPQNFIEHIAEGGIAQTLLANARGSREGYFTAPKANKIGLSTSVA